MDYIFYFYLLSVVGGDELINIWIIPIRLAKAGEKTALFVLIVFERIDF